MTLSISKEYLLAKKQELDIASQTVARLLAELCAAVAPQSGDKSFAETTPSLTFGKNVISWGHGKALSIGGNGYKLVKALYGSDKMILDEPAVGLLLWNDDMPNRKNFKETIRRTMEALELARFPYRLLWVKSEERYERTGAMLKSGRPAVRRVQPMIIGVKLDARQS